MYSESNEAYGKGHSSMAKQYEIVSGYIPKYMADQIIPVEHFNGIGDEDLMEKYFATGKSKASSSDT